MCGSCVRLEGMNGLLFFFFFNDTATTEIYTLSLHDALPIFEPVIKESLKVKKPVFMDFVVDWKEKVYPMVPAGAAIDEMLFEEKEGKKEKKKLKAVK